MPIKHHDFTPIMKLLSFAGDRRYMRNIIVLAGTEHWQNNTLNKLFIEQQDTVLWVTDKDITPYLTVAFEKVKTWLGQEKKFVIFDANQSFDADNIAAISGIVLGGGLFVLLLPSLSQWKSVCSSLFAKRFINSVTQNEDIVVIDEVNLEIKYQKQSPCRIPIPHSMDPYLSVEQQEVVEKIHDVINAKTQQAIVLQSDRGRGKSAALGLAIVLLLKDGVDNIIITAPKRRALDVVFKHIAEQLPNAKVQGNSIIYGSSTVNFFPPDDLINQSTNTGILFIDEAAAIPVPMLTKFLKRYPHCVFATTVHGYEGTGRGFALRFVNELDKHDAGWVQLNMLVPIRWPINDPLERWINKLLCLDVDLITIEDCEKINTNNIQYKVLEQAALAADNTLLGSIFSLLVFAHYRTRPSDLQALFDDDSISLYVGIDNKIIVAVALVMREGGFDKTLSTAIYQGKRRVKGHLLAQSLSYHCGVEYAASLDYARIMRIAVHPQLQNKGIGSALLDFVIKTESDKGRDAIGVSYGLNYDLLRFWLRLNFKMIRIGFTQEKTSGEHAAIMMHVLSSKANAISVEAMLRFNRQCHYWFNDILKNIPDNIQQLLDLPKKEPVEMIALDDADLQSFLADSRNFELCIGAINLFVNLKMAEIVKDDFPADFRKILTCKIRDLNDWSEVVERMNLKGKNAARALFHQAVSYLGERCRN